MCESHTAGILKGGANDAGGWLVGDAAQQQPVHPTWGTGLLQSAIQQRIVAHNRSYKAGPYLGRSVRAVQRTTV